MRTSVVLPLHSTTRHHLNTHPLLAAWSLPPDITCDVNGGDDVAAVTATIDTTPKDVEAGNNAAASAGPTKHYVPLLVLFRGHWSGILIQIFYEACECSCSCCTGWEGASDGLSFHRG